jgi:hypothetical protein
MHKVKDCCPKEYLYPSTTLFKTVFAIYRSAETLPAYPTV